MINQKLCQSFLKAQIRQVMQKFRVCLHFRFLTFLTKFNEKDLQDGWR